VFAKINHVKLLANVAILMMVITSVLLVGVVIAAGNSPQSYENFAGITTAIASKNAFKFSSPYYLFQCDSLSYTSSPSVNITQIGYNSFGCNVYRDGTYYNGWVMPTGELNYNASGHSDSGYLTVYPASSSRVVTAEGSHDFGHFDGTSYHWDPGVWKSNTYVP
jgi:hypothetical protein